MSELIRIPTAFGIGSHLGEAVTAALVARDRLPADFHFRMFGLAPNDRKRIATTDVLAAMDCGPESPEAATYLHGPLPDCIHVPVSELRDLRAILRQVPEDYHMLADMQVVTETLKIPRYVAQQTWALLIAHCNPPLHERLQSVRSPDAAGYRASAGNSRAVQFAMHVNRVVIKDSVLVDVHTEPTKLPTLGPRHRRILRHLLADNHPEYIEVPVE